MTAAASVRVPVWRPTFNVPEDALPPDAGERIYGRQVKGDCMAGDDIRDGDIAIMDPERQAVDGDVCTVWINWKAGRAIVLKRVRFDGPELVRLEPSNPAYAHELMILTPEDGAVIEGVMITRFRRI